VMSLSLLRPRISHLIFHSKWSFLWCPCLKWLSTITHIWHKCHFIMKCHKEWWMGVDMAILSTQNQHTQSAATYTTFGRCLPTQGCYKRVFACLFMQIMWGEEACALEDNLNKVMLNKVTLSKH
jgi:hypothetical protein